MSDRFKYEAWDFFARLCAVLPPLGTTLYFFPEWIERSPRATFSGMLVVWVLVCMIPFWKKIVSLAKEFTSTAMPVFWLISFVLMLVLKDIIDRFAYIALFGFIGSLISMVVCGVFRNKYAGSAQKGSKEE